MIIDNGRRRRLLIDGVFEGECGESRGVLAFIPNIFRRPAKLPLGGLLDGEPIILTKLEPTEDGIALTARYQAFGA